MADAGFGSVELVVFIGKKAKESGTKLHAIVCVKQAHALFPKEILEATLKDAPGGKWATLEFNIEGVDVVAVGYKYNSKKVIFFVMTKGAGSTEPGEPHVVQFTSPLLSAPSFSLPSPFSPLRFLSSILPAFSSVCPLRPSALCPLSSLLSPLRCHFFGGFSCYVHLFRRVSVLLKYI